MKSMYAAWWDGFLDADGAPDPNGRYLGRYWYVSDDSARVTATEVLARRPAAHRAHRAHAAVRRRRPPGTTRARRSAEGAGHAARRVFAGLRQLRASRRLGDAAPTDTAIRRVGFFAQDQIKLADRLSVRAGVRRDRVGNTVVGGEGTRRLGHDRQRRRRLRGRGRASRRTPATRSRSIPVPGTDAAGEVFKPKRGEQIEAGLKWESPSVPVQASRGLLHHRGTQPPRDRPRELRQEHPDRRGARSKASSWKRAAKSASWTLLGSYTWTQARATAGVLRRRPRSGAAARGHPRAPGVGVGSRTTLRTPGLAGVTLGGGAALHRPHRRRHGQRVRAHVTLFDLMASYAIRQLARVAQCEQPDRQALHRHVPGPRRLLVRPAARGVGDDRLHLLTESGDSWTFCSHLSPASPP